MRGDQVSLNEMAGSLAIAAEEHRDTKVEDGGPLWSLVAEDADFMFASATGRVNIHPGGRNRASAKVKRLKTSRIKFRNF
jgi:hypothetical protein